MREGMRTRAWGFLAVLAASIVVAACTNGGSSTAPSPSPSQATQSPTTSPTAPAPTATQVLVDQPWTTSGKLASGLEIAKSAKGSCFAASIADERPDAWRCMEGHFINGSTSAAGPMGYKDARLSVTDAVGGTWVGTVSIDAHTCVKIHTGKGKNTATDKYFRERRRTTESLFLVLASSCETAVGSGRVNEAFTPRQVRPITKGCPISSSSCDLYDTESAGRASSSSVWLRWS